MAGDEGAASQAREMMENPFEARDRSTAGDLSPVWRMLALSATHGGVAMRAPVVRALPVPDQPWRDSIVDGLEEAAATGATLIIPVERPWARAILTLLAHRRWRLVKTPSATEIKRELDRLGASVVATYSLWPSARTPRIAFPKGKTRLLTWAQRSGVLGGGGNRLWARVAARSPLFTPFAIMMSPGLALVVRVGTQRDA
jgi:hypothetical protein